MDEVRQVASAALSLRKANKLRVRLPLAKLVVAAPNSALLAPFTEIISDEVNVKQVELTTDVAAHGHFELAVNARACGPRLGRDVQKVIRAVKAGEWSTTEAGAVVAAGIELLDGEYERKLVATDPAATAALPGGNGLVVLDTAVTDDLAVEGVARDVVRAVQQARRDAGLDVSDRIALTVYGPEQVLDAVRAHEKFVAGETLADCGGLRVRSTRRRKAPPPRPSATALTCGSWSSRARNRRAAGARIPTTGPTSEEVGPVPSRPGPAGPPAARRAAGGTRPTRPAPPTMPIGSAIRVCWSRTPSGCSMTAIACVPRTGVGATNSNSARRPGWWRTHR